MCHHGDQVTAGWPSAGSLSQLRNFLPPLIARLFPPPPLSPPPPPPPPPLSLVHVASPGGPKSVLANTFTPPKLDSLIQPPPNRLIALPHVNGSSFQPPLLGNEGVGPIRSHIRQAVRERPSPVAYDGEYVNCAKSRSPSQGRGGGGGGGEGGRGGREGGLSLLSTSWFHSQALVAIPTLLELPTDNTQSCLAPPPTFINCTPSQPTISVIPHMLTACISH